MQTHLLLAVFFFWFCPGSIQVLICLIAVLLQVVKELQVSLFQTMCLLLFNDQNEVTYEEVVQATGIGKYDCSGTLFHPFSLPSVFLTF